MQTNQGAWAGTFPGPNGQIAFLRNGQSVGFIPQIYVMNADDGSEQTRLTANSSQNGHPSWSPDGTKIAFASDRDDANVFEIYVMNADGSEQTRLTDDPAFDGLPSWSPDGTKIAFQRGFGEIYVMNADDGSGVTRLTDNTDIDETPSWSPDGTKIAFASNRDHNWEIYVMNADDGSEQTNISNNPANDLHPSWSPDGTKIAFDSDRDGNGNTEIYSMNADDGSEQTRLTDNTRLDEIPSWSPDGTKIAFASIRDSPGNYEIYSMNADDGSDLTRLTDDADEDFDPDWGTNTSPAGGGGNGDTTSPVITVPQDITEEATSTDGAEVRYTVTAQDNVDGNATLEEDGSTITQDDIGGDIDISCEPASGTTFPIGDTTVECSATDEAGNTGTASFTVTVNPPSPLTPAQEAIEELISTIQNLDNVPQDVKTSLTAVLNEVLNILNDNNPNNDESVCRTLDAFINQVNANETSDTLAADEADELSTQGEDIRNALDC
jgi:Tol biopolymer transport system component